VRIRDYTVGDTSAITAELLNNVTGDFSNAMAEAYLELRDLKARNITFRNAVDSSMSYLIGRINALTTAITGLKINAYNSPISATNIQLDHTYGQLSLAEYDRVTHIPTDDDNFGQTRALSSVSIETGATETSFAENNDIRVVIDDEDEIWATTLDATDTDSGSIWIRLTTPLTGQVPNFIAVYPLGGTIVDTIKVRHQSGYTEFNPISEWPIKYHQTFSDYQNEVRIKITGVLTPDGLYEFALKKIDVYTVRYASEGTFTYLTPDAFTNVSSVTYNSAYFYPIASQSPGMIRIRILTEDGLTVLYDSSRESSAFVVPAGPKQILVEGTLYRTDGSTPFIRTIV
jgi:hypothetical protein